MQSNTLFKRVLITVMCGLLICLSSCYSVRMNNYYSQKENYITVTGKVSYINYDEGSVSLYIGLSEMSQDLDDSCFKLVGDNLRTVRMNGIDAKLEVGTNIELITAPEHFGDGYVMPVVAISINGESLLDFEEGYNNLLNWLSR